MFGNATEAVPLVTVDASKFGPNEVPVILARPTGTAPPPGTVVRASEPYVSRPVDDARSKLSVAERGDTRQTKATGGRHRNSVPETTS